METKWAKNLSICIFAWSTALGCRPGGWFSTGYGLPKGRVGSSPQYPVKWFAHAINRILDIFRSYYGGLISVCWSPDGKYIVTGGQDDLVTIWSFPERKIVARCQGHNSWVSAVAFDPWRCDERTYRFGSVGDDCRLLLWDFNVGMLHRPRAVRVVTILFSGLESLLTNIAIAPSQCSPADKYRRAQRQPPSSRQRREPGKIWFSTYFEYVR